MLVLLQAPRGVLLHGPPGTGKTFIVPALAAEARAHLEVCVYTYIDRFPPLFTLAFQVCAATWHLPNHPARCAVHICFGMLALGS